MGTKIAILKGKNYLSLEQSAKHPDRHKERLPSNKNRVTRKKKFHLGGSRARTTIERSECNKPRIIFRKKQPSKLYISLRVLYMSQFGLAEVKLKENNGKLIQPYIANLY